MIRVLGTMLYSLVGQPHGKSRYQTPEPDILMLIDGRSTGIKLLFDN